MCFSASILVALGLPRSNFELLEKGDFHRFVLKLRTILYSNRQVSDKSTMTFLHLFLELRIHFHRSWSRIANLSFTGVSAIDKGVVTSSYFRLKSTRRSFRVYDKADEEPPILFLT